MIVTTTVVNTIYDLENKDIENQMRAVEDNLTKFVEPYFRNEKFILARDSVKGVFDELEKTVDTYRFENSAFYQKALKDLQYADSVGGDAVQSVWIAGVSNNQVIQSDGYITDKSFDITQRVWYQLMEQNLGFNILTPVYEDTATGELSLLL